ncbi:MAG: AMP-binding protein [bacterium]|nr:AMP-binding protein [bacterium]
MSRYEGEWVLSRILQDRADRMGDKAFIVADSGDLTYADTIDRAGRVAAGLQELGVAPGDRVATMLPPTTDYISAWFGTSWAGAVDVPINNEFKGEFLRHLLADSGAKVMVCQDRWVSRLEQLDLPNLETVIVVGDTVDLPGRQSADFAEMLAFDPAPAVPRTERDLVYIMYTSGTTGPSKGVMHGNRSALWNSAAWIDILDLGPDDRAYSMFPLFHVTARSAIVGSSLMAGGSVALRSGFSLSGFWEDVRETESTFFAYMGAVIHLLYAQDPTPDDAAHSVRRAFGAAAPPEIAADFERRFGFPLLEVYGSTELGVATAPLGGRRKAGTMGLTCNHLHIEVHDEDDNLCPPGVEGEIVARPAEAEAMFRSYWQRPEYSVEAFRNLWFHTGDGGYMDGDGFLVFTDRLKDSIRRRGENISSFEVERAVQTHPDVLECGAYAVPSELTEDEVMIAVVARDGHDVDVPQLFQHCIEQMPRFAVPRYIRLMDELPKTPSQRIQKYKLRDQGVTEGTHDREALGIEVPRE